MGGSRNFRAILIAAAFMAPFLAMNAASADTNVAATVSPEIVADTESTTVSAGGFKPNSSVDLLNESGFSRSVPPPMPAATPASLGLPAASTASTTYGCRASTRATSPVWPGVCSPSGRACRLRRTTVSAPGGYRTSLVFPVAIGAALIAGGAVLVVRRRRGYTDLPFGFAGLGVVVLAGGLAFSVVPPRRKQRRRALSPAR